MGAFRNDIQKWGYTFDQANYLVESTHKRVIPSLPTIELYPQAASTIQTVGKRGAQQAIVTTSRRRYIEPALRYYNIHHYFGTIVTADDVVQQKPHRESIDTALRHLDGTNTHAVIIGDSKKDLLAAKNAGIASILFYPPENEEFYRLADLTEFE